MSAALRHDVDPRLSRERQRAIRKAYSDVNMLTLVLRDERRRVFARHSAETCRTLIAAFGVRRPQRIELQRDGAA